MANYYIGVDGGGTGCRAVVADANGTPLGFGLGGAANIVTDPQSALANVLHAVDTAFDNAALDKAHYSCAHAVFGLAGANVEGASDAIVQALPFANVDVEFDGLIALQGALGNDDGVATILGTGTAYIIRKGGQVHSVGGWGFPLSDLGSGARLGQSLLQHCLLVYDGIHRTSQLAQDVLDEFNNKPDNLVEFGRNAQPGDYGKYAPRIFDYAENGDKIACMLLEKSASHIAETLDMLIGQGAERISLLGGLAKPYVSWLPAHQQKLLVKPMADALTGALQLALMRFQF